MWYSLRPSNQKCKTLEPRLCLRQKLIKGRKYDHFSTYPFESFAAAHRELAAGCDPDPARGAVRGGAHRLNILTGATGGYLIGFALAAYVIGLLAERGLERSVPTSIIPFLAGTLIIYVCGVAWLTVFLGSLSKALVAGVLPFLIGDAIKLVAASLALPAGWRLFR